PYPWLEELRRAAPLVWHAPTQMWLAATHAAVSETLRSRALWRLWRDREPAGRFAPFNALHRHQMMENEPPVHTRLRRLVTWAFARGHVERMRPRVESLATELLDRLPTGRVDVVAHYAEPLPVAVIADLLGVPPVDRPRLRDWSQAIVRMYEYERTEALENAAIAASQEFSEYVRDLVGERRRNPGEDLVSDLVAARDDGVSLSDDELVASVVLLLNAGHEASVNAFGNGLVALLRHPEQLARLATGELGIETALEEMLRYDAPLQLFERTATQQVAVASCAVEPGQKVAALLGSANRDESVFASPERFDVGRAPNPHVGFGMGVHFCLGAPLARMELEVSLATLLDRFPALELAAEPAQRPTFVLRGFERIDVDLGKPA
nr:cytochrome P450 [Nocardioidaceae bacterium]